MSSGYRKFDKNDILINTLKAHPRSEFYIYRGSIYYNNQAAQQGKFASNVRMVDTGYINLYEYNIDKLSGSNNYSYPYLSKDSSRVSLHMTSSAVSSEDLATEFAFGDLITGSYPQYASIRREFITTPSGSCGDLAKSTCGHNMSYWSLRPTLNHYGTLSDHYRVTSSHGNKDAQELNIIHIPSIFYGNRMKPGTLSLRWYLTGSLIGELTDPKQNGELIQTGPAGSVGSGSVQGVVLYNEGFLILTGAVPIVNDISEKLALRLGTASEKWPRWIYWGAGARDGVTEATLAAAGGSTGGNSFVSASFGLNFEGETTTETMTLYAHARRAQVNFSNNPTSIRHGQQQLEFTSSHLYEENKERLLKNTVSSSFDDYDADFKRQVYISKIGVYDENKNLIGIATLADPVLKEENEDYAFKLKIDI